MAVEKKSNTYLFKSPNFWFWLTIVFITYGTSQFIYTNRSKFIHEVNGEADFGAFVVLVIILLIFIFWIVNTKSFLNEMKFVNNQINEFNQAFKDINDSKEFLLSFETVNQKIEKIDHFSEIWHEFRETLIFEKNKNRNTNPLNKVTDIKNTAQVEHYISFHSVVEPQTKISFYEAFPSILTGLGLVGTFLSITLALAEFKTGNSQVLQKSIESLLGGLSLKFGSSLAGILSSIIFISFKKKSISNLEEKIHKLQIKLNSIFPRKTSEHLLNDMLAEIQQQTTDLKDFLQDMDFTNAIKAAFDQSIDSDLKPVIGEVKSEIEDLKEVNKKNTLDILRSNDNLNQTQSEYLKLQNEYIETIKAFLEIEFRNMVDNQTNKLLESTRDISLNTTEIANINNTVAELKEALQRTMSEMNVAINALREAKEESPALLIEKLVSELKESMAEMQKATQEGILNGAGGAVNDLGQNLLEASSCLTGIKDTFNHFMTKIEQQMTSSSEQRDSATQELIQSILERISSYTEELNHKIGSLIGQMNGFDEKRNSELEQNIGKITDQVSYLLESMKDSNSKVIDGTSNAIQSISNNVIQLQSGMSDSLENNLNLISDKITNILSNFENYSQENSSQQKELHQTVTDKLLFINNSFKESLDRQNIKFNEWASSLNGYSARSLENSKIIESSFDNVLNQIKGALENQKSIISSTTTLIRNLDESASKLSNTANYIDRAGNLLSNSIESSNSLQELSKDVISKIIENIKLWEKEQEVFDNLNQTANQVVETLTKSTQAFVHKYEENNQNIFNQYADQFNGLRHVVEEQKRILESLEDTLT